jgi:carboxypeptidase T
LTNSGIPFDVVIGDMEAHYATRFVGTVGNYGIYHTYSQVVTWLDDLHTAYPNVVSAKWSLGQSGQGNDIWCVRVSDNPEVDEAGEPEVMFDGMHHAREIMASEMPVMLIEYLASNYGTDPTITYLLDNREIYVVPVVNPDGSLYNESTNPSGGGMWRKNRRNNGDGSYGVDPNRNYPYEWVGPGSSTDPSSDTYRGPSPGSEPEIQALMGLFNSHAFVTAQSFHSYSNLTLYPWGYTNSDSPHEAIFVHMADIMTRDNGYAPGQPGELLYTVNGGSFDWVYGASLEHPTCFSFTNEIGSGSDGFWPLESRRDALFQENLWPSIYQIMASGLYVEAHTPVVIGGDGNGRLDAGETAGLSFSLENLGVVTTASNVTVTLSTDDPYIVLQETSRNLGGMGAMSTIDASAAPFMVDVNAVLPASRSISVHLVVDADGVVSEYDLVYPAGSSSVLFADDFESGTGEWVLTGNWGTTSSSSHSATTSLTDSPVGEYGDETLTSATTVSPINLPAGATLSFWHSYEIESNYDYGYVRVSTDQSSWNTVATYDGYATSWAQVEVNLDAYAGQTVWIRFEFDTDYSVTYDGWYIDDVSVSGVGSTNLLPPAPALLDPLDGGLFGSPFNLTCGTVIDPEGDPVTYGFRVYDNVEMTNVVFASSGVASVGAQAQDEVASLNPGQTYWWRAFAADTEEWGLMGDVRSFTVDTTSGVGIDLGRLTLRSISNTNGSTLQLDLPRSGDVTVEIFNARGQVVRTLASGHHDSGLHRLSWDGRDVQGRNSASGVYFVRAQAGQDIVTTRVTMVR